MKSILVIGMGRFGRHLATKMLELKNYVMIVDKNEEIINELAPKFTDAYIGDCTNEDVLEALGINNFDICFVTIGENFQASLEITSLLKDLGAKYVVSKAKRNIQEKFLLRNGADEVIYPERDMAIKLAIRHNAKKIFDYIDLTPDFGIYEIPVVESWIGKSIQNINVRRAHGISILAIKNGTELKPLPEADYTFKQDDHMIVIGQSGDVFRLTDKT